MYLLVKSSFDRGRAQARKITYLKFHTNHYKQAIRLNPPRSSDFLFWSFSYMGSKLKAEDAHKIIHIFPSQESARSSGGCGVKVST